MEWRDIYIVYIESRFIDEFVYHNLHRHAMPTLGMYW